MVDKLGWISPGTRERPRWFGAFCDNGDPHLAAKDQSQCASQYSFATVSRSQTTSFLAPTRGRCAALQDGPNFRDS